jgi:ribose 1,5-bisphosphokinase PhnN
MNDSTELIHALLSALDRVPGLRPATLAKAGLRSWGWNRDGLAIDVTPDVTPEADGGQVVVIRVVATRLPLPPVVRQAEQALLTVLIASDVPITRLRLEITDVDGTAFGEDHPR